MVNSFELRKLHKEVMEKALATMRKKNSDYTGTSNDPFFNFRQSENFGICSAEESILIRKMDKLSRIKSFLDKGVLEVADEKIEDTLEDDINYSILLLGMIKSKKTKEVGDE